ncbi:DUF2255 family protein [Companilactobacillus sp. HBUAS56275]|uniref:DUF2255 family protein n=1 Tax=Candidatus Companilactobacillus pullicola TaxID=2838523 RepID=A0A9D1ZR90_9LACO|nr:DUF2255 family protein [Candidatus Companilactobacillus pullicola]
MTSKNTWALEQLQKFSQADDFRVSPFYSDGKTYGTPTWIWSVVVDHRLFIRAWNGQNSRWYRSAIQQQGGRIFLDGSNHEVIFKKLHDDKINELVDQGYRDKYGESCYFPPMIQNGPRSTTIEVLPK